MWVAYFWTLSLLVICPEYGSQDVACSMPSRFLASVAALVN